MMIFQIKKTTFVVSAGVLTPSRFKAPPQSYSDPSPFQTSLLKAFAPFIDVNSKDWQWSENSDLLLSSLPICSLISIISSSPFRGLLLTQDVVKMIIFKVNIVRPWAVSFNAGWSVCDRITSSLVRRVHEFAPHYRIIRT